MRNCADRASRHNRWFDAQRTVHHVPWRRLGGLAAIHLYKAADQPRPRARRFGLVLHTIGIGRTVMKRFAKLALIVATVSALSACIVLPRPWHAGHGGYHGQGHGHGHGQDRGHGHRHR
jgi:hypothetical protein